MSQDISKRCADSLRTFSYENHNIKLKPAHAHELVAAFFGYSSKNALLADKKHPISSFDQAEIVVMTPANVVDRRRSNLQELSTELPDSYVLGKAVYDSLFSGGWCASPYPPFKDFKQCAKFLVERNDTYKDVFKFYVDISVHHIVDVSISENGVLLTVIHSHKNSTGEILGHGRTTIDLPLVAGRIGFGKPQVSVELLTGGAKIPLESLGEQS